MPCQWIFTKSLGLLTPTHSLVQSPKKTKFVLTGSQWLPFLIKQSPKMLKRDWLQERGAAKIFHVANQRQGWVRFSRNLLSRDCLTNSSPFEKLSLSQRSDWLREKEKRYLKQIDSGNHWLVGAVHILCWHWWLDQLLTTIFSDRCETN